MWGLRIKKILRSRLPERFSGTLPPLLVEVAVGVALPLLLGLLRFALLPWIGETAPYALVFVAVVGAAVLAGWRGGLIALVTGQALIWFFVLQAREPYATANESSIGGLLLASTAQLMTLAIVVLYQREVDRAWARRETQVGLIEKALNEIDHRTSNNYQTVLALILAQAKDATDDGVRDALHKVADRIRAIANASRKLAVASESLEEIRAAEHLQDLCEQIERGLSRPGIALSCRFDDVVLGADQTVGVSILVNELVTNALKHAFPGDRAGTIAVTLMRVSGGVELVVEDNGVGIDSAAGNRGTGLGKRLIDTFVKQVKARHEITTGTSGTRHRIRMPA